MANLHFTSDLATPDVLEKLDAYTNAMAEYAGNALAFRALMKGQGVPIGAVHELLGSLGTGPDKALAAFTDFNATVQARAKEFTGEA